MRPVSAPAVTNTGPDCSSLMLSTLCPTRLLLHGLRHGLRCEAFQLERIAVERRERAELEVRSMLERGERADGIKMSGQHGDRGVQSGTNRRVVRQCRLWHQAKAVTEHSVVVRVV